MGTKVQLDDDVDALVDEYIRSQPFRLNKRQAVNAIIREKMGVGETRPTPSENPGSPSPPPVTPKPSPPPPKESTPSKPINRFMDFE